MNYFNTLWLFPIMFKEPVKCNAVIKCVAFLCLILVSLNRLYAQTATEKYSTIDSLNKEGLRLYNIDFDRALQIASEALAMSLDHHYIKGIVASTCLKSRVEVNVNKCREALNSLGLLVPMVLDKADTPALTMLYSTIGICWFDQGNYDSAKAYQVKAVQMTSVSGKISIPYAYACVSLAKIYIKTGNPLKAKQYYQIAVAIFSKMSDEEGILKGQELMGELFYSQRLYEKAIEVLDKSYGGFKKAGHLSGAASTLLYMGNSSYMLMRDDSAEACYVLALNNFASLGDMNGMIMCYSNLSRIHLEKRDYRLAIEYANKAIQNIVPGNYANIEANTFQQLGDIYGEMKEYQKAVASVQKAMYIARTIDDKTIIKDCYKSLSELYEAMKMPELAIKNLLAAYRLKDSIQPVTFGKQLADMEAEYEAEKKRIEIKLLKQNGLINTLKLNAQENILKKQRYLLALLFVIMGVIFLTIYYTRSKQKLVELVTKQNVIRETEEKERMRIAKDIHDELGSGLSKIRFLTELAGTKMDVPLQLSESLQSISETSKGLVENMRDLVWAMNPENTTLDNLVARIREYSYDYLEEFPVEVVFDFPETVPDLKISKEVNRNIYMIVKEALQNIVKHADASKVTICLSTNKGFKLEIIDNGKGYDEVLKTEGDGLKNLRARSLTLGARIDLISHKGVGSSVKFELDVL